MRLTCDIILLSSNKLRSHSTSIFSTIPCGKIEESKFIESKSNLLPSKLCTVKVSSRKINRCVSVSSVKLSRSKILYYHCQKIHNKFLIVQYMRMQSHQFQQFCLLHFAVKLLEIFLF